MVSNINTGAAIKGLTGRAQVSGQGNGGGSHRAAGLVVTATLGLALLASGIISQVRPTAQPASPAAVVNPIVSDIGYMPDQFTYREDHRAIASSSFVADQFTYREDHRIGTTSAFVPGFWTYREDLRATSTNEQNCVYADYFGVPGEGCDVPTP